MNIIKRLWLIYRVSLSLFFLGIGEVSLQLSSLAREETSCLISGQIYSSSRQLENNLSIVLFNSNQSRPLAKYPIIYEAAGVGKYRIRVDHSGRYILRIFRGNSSSAFPIKSNPSQARFTCDQGLVKNIDFILP